VVAEHHPDPAPQDLGQEQLAPLPDQAPVLVLVRPQRQQHLRRHPQQGQTVRALPQHLDQAQTPNQVLTLYQAVFQQNLRLDR
tara:strand:- start:440 stop:688 length:249 start_codon:yes stop_codon:yes gene_type:complete